MTLIKLSYVFPVYSKYKINKSHNIYFFKLFFLQPVSTRRRLPSSHSYVRMREKQREERFRNHVAKFTEAMNGAETARTFQDAFERSPFPVFGAIRPVTPHPSFPGPPPPIAPFAWPRLHPTVMPFPVAPYFRPPFLPIPCVGWNGLNGEIPQNLAQCPPRIRFTYCAPPHIQPRVVLDTTCESPRHQFTASNVEQDIKAALGIPRGPDSKANIGLH